MYQTDDDTVDGPNPVYFIGSVKESLEAFSKRPSMLVEGLLPAQGTVLLHGRFSLGKSPFGWKLAQCVSEGTNFFGYAVPKAGPVVWLEVDENLVLSNQRLRLLDPYPSQLTLVGLHYIDINDLKAGHIQALLELSALQPKLVIVNTLRKVHTLEDINSRTANIVYSGFQRFFPHSCVLFIHHDRKQSTNEHGQAVAAGDESFAGTQAFANDAQVALHMTQSGAAGANQGIQIEVTKSQLGPTGDKIKLKLSPDGVTWLNTGAFSIKTAFDQLDATLPKMERYEIVARQLGVSIVTVRRALKSA